MLDLAATIRKSLYSPKVWVKELWLYNYQDFRLIFEQSDILHCFYVSANTQRMIARALVVVVGMLLSLIMVLAINSAVSIWQYKSLEASKLEADKKKQEAFAALAVLADGSLDYKKTASQEELIQVARSYHERLNKMQTLIKFSSHELKLAYGALEQGLKASGIAENSLRKIKISALLQRCCCIGSRCSNCDTYIPIPSTLITYGFNKFNWKKLYGAGMKPVSSKV